VNPLELHNFIKLLLDWDAERITALSTGLVFGVVLTWTLAKRFLTRSVIDRDGTLRTLRLKSRRLADLLQAKEAAHYEQRVASEEKVEALHAQLADVLESAHKQSLESEKLQQELTREREEVRNLNQRLQTEWTDKQQLQTDNWQLGQDKADLQQSVTALENNDRSLAARVTELTNEKIELQAVVQTLQQRLQSEVEKVQQFNEKCEQLQETVDDQYSMLARPYRGAQDPEQRAQVEKELAALQQQVRLITDLEGKVWEQPPAEDIPPIRSDQDAGAKMIAVANLKGGVGKTTLTANLGAALASRGYRVLMVDLDYQQSLTTLCLRDEKAAQVRIFGRVVRNLFSSPQLPDEAAWQNLTDIEGRLQLHLLATDEWLVDEEERAKFAWLLDPERRDVRYLFRSAFHAPRFQQSFDVILFDCPPRLTTTCINALACADFVMIPVLLDKTSADAVPRLLHWLNRLRTCGVCANLSRAGVVGNAGRLYNGAWTRPQQDILHQLRDTCPNGPVSVYHFEQVVPYRSEFAEAAEKHTFASLGKALSGVFGNLVDELIQGKVIHESPRLAAVP
jgi:cellulose biosynthesis protein BcsQ